MRPHQNTCNACTSERTPLLTQNCVENAQVLQVSVIIPTLNEQHTIAAAIDSATQAGAGDIIVVDGGSADQTTHIAARHAAVTVLTSDQPGRATQQNLGAQNATGDVLLFLHADCRLSPDSISDLVNRVNSSTEIVAGCFRQKIDQPGYRYRSLEAGNLWRVRLLKWAYGDQGIFVRSSVFREHDGFPDVCFLEDLLLMKKLRRAGRVIVLDSHIEVSARRWQQRGVLGQTLRNWLIVAMAQLGVTPERLSKFYPNDR